MRSVSFLVFVLLTILCWGMYAPILHEGQVGLGSSDNPSLLRAFVCVGVAYFFTAVSIPLLAIRTEKSSWTVSGIIWSFAAGVIGALGASGLVLTFTFGGSPIFVMPLIFGCAPVINTMATMLMSRTIRQASVAFYLGVILVALGAAGVMAFKPDPGNATPHEHADEATERGSQEELVATTGTSSKILMFGSMMMTALCWGIYGPVLHQGQAKMGGSRMKPFLLIGLAYLLVGVVLPLMGQQLLEPEPGEWNLSGASWSFGAGAAGAIGALGIIFAFNSGGKPISVMPLVYGGAPVVNTFSSLLIKGGQTSIWFLASLALVILGAVVVLICSPRSQPRVV